MVLCFANQGKIDKNKIKEVLEEDFYNDLLEIKDGIKLDRMII